MDINSLHAIIILIPVILISLTIHEYAHGWMALKCGDTTARDMGRLTFNPFKHLDLFGTLMMIGTYFFFHSPFGWAKPVPINPRNFNNPKRDIMLVSFAGPLSNIIAAVISVIMLNISLTNTNSAPGSQISQFLFLLTIVNINLAIFNLLPLPPLDGSKILIGVLPNHVIPSYIRFTQNAGFIVMVLILLEQFIHLKTISYVLTPLIYFSSSAFLKIFGINTAGF